MLYQLIKADVLERFRSTGFLVVQGLALLLAYSVVNGKVVLQLGGYVGELNSAWIGLQMTQVALVFFAWFGFYTVRGSVSRDYETGVGQIIATTPLNRVLYVLGKAISTFAVLLSMTAIMILGAIWMLVFSGTATLELWALLSPFVVLALPLFSLIAATVVLFDVIPWLRGAFGNALYFIMLPFLMVTWTDQIFAFGLVQKYTATEIHKIDPTYQSGFQIGIPGLEVEGEVFEPALKTFLWNGFDWTPDLILERLTLVGIALLVVLVAALFFDRFDPSKRGLAKLRKRKKPKKAPPRAKESPIDSAGFEAQPIKLRPLPQRSANSFWPVMLLKAELKLLLRGQAWWWYAGLFAGVLAGLFSPIGTLRSLILPLVWIWPLAIWSELGNREKHHHTHQMVFSGPQPLRQIGTIWLAGFLVTLLAGSGVGLRLLVTGDPGLFAWWVGALFIPSLALALGVWSNGPRAFQVIYLAFWYLGPLNEVHYLDYLGAFDRTIGLGFPLVYLAISIGLLALAFVGRARQLQQ